MSKVLQRPPSPAMAVALLALFVALGGTGYAAVRLSNNSVLSRHIKNGQVKRADLGRNAVDATKVKDGSLLASDFAAGAAGLKGPPGERGPQGTPGQAGAVGAPGAPATIKRTLLETYSNASTTTATSYVKLADIGTFIKDQAASAIKLLWNGEVSFDGGGTTYCKVQLRIDGEDAAGATGAGNAAMANPGNFVISAGSGEEQAAVVAVFDGLAAGQHTVSLWANNVNGTSCALGGMSNYPRQTIYVEEGR